MSNVLLGGVHAYTCASDSKSTTYEDNGSRSDGRFSFLWGDRNERLVNTVVVIENHEDRVQMDVQWKSVDSEEGLLSIESYTNQWIQSREAQTGQYNKVLMNYVHSSLVFSPRFTGLP